AQAGNAPRAAATARSTSARADSGASAIGSPVAGLTTGSWSAVATGSPPMKLERDERAVDMPANVAAVRGPGNHLRPVGCRCLSKAPPLEEPGSPFPPIKEYAFLSDCHTGALLAPDGTVEWLCVPRFDAPSIFGSLLDRGAGGFRLGPYGVGVPDARRYEPGTHILETTWMTPTGWAVVREALCIGPWRDVEDQVTPHTRPPVDQDAAHVLV